MNSKTKKAEYLFDEIGQIDDALLVEAMSVKGKRRPFIPVLIAATLTLSLVLMLCGAAVLGVAISVIDKIGDSVADSFAPNDGAANGGSTNAPTPDTYTDLDSLMVSYKGGSFTTLEKDEIPYHNGETYIVWQYEGEAKYYMSKPLYSSEVRSLEQSFGQGEQVSAEGAELNCKVWIILPDGRVRSPYLKNTDGNTGAAVFDYNPEIYPTRDFVDNVSAIID